MEVFLNMYNNNLSLRQRKQEWSEELMVKEINPYTFPIVIYMDFMSLLYS